MVRVCGVLNDWLLSAIFVVETDATTWGLRGERDHTGWSGEKGYVSSGVSDILFCKRETRLGGDKKLDENLDEYGKSCERIY